MVYTRAFFLKSIFRAIALASLVMVIVPAFAADLDQARASGLVGERPDGLVGLVKPNAPPDIAAMVETVNKQRLDTYRPLANKDGSPLAAVQKVAGDKQIVKARQNGWFWMDAAGAWHKG